MIYLDWAASAPPDPEALDTVRDVSSRHFANPSSAHSAGKAAKDLLEKARASLTRSTGGGRVVFTSGATESNASVLTALLQRQALKQPRGGTVRVVLSSMEHASVYEQALRLRDLGVQAVLVNPGRNGIMDPHVVAEAVDADTVMVSVMAVNNETGAVQPIREISDAVRRAPALGGRRILIHADAAQGFGKIPFNPLGLGIDAASLSAHKIGGPRGVGALWLASETSVDLLSAGGGQESGMRPGTENLPGICGFAAAAEKRLAGCQRELEEAHVKSAFLVEELGKIPRIRFFPEVRGLPGAFSPGSFSPFILCFGFPPLPGEVLVRHADSRGFLIGTGSACSSKKKNRTRVLEGMGVRADTALSAVRVSFGPGTPASDLERFVEYARKEMPALLSGAAGM